MRLETKGAKQNCVVLVTLVSENEVESEVLSLLYEFLKKGTKEGDLIEVSIGRSLGELNKRLSLRINVPSSSGVYGM